MSEGVPVEFVGGPKDGELMVIEPHLLYGLRILIVRAPPGPFAEEPPDISAGTFYEIEYGYRAEVVRSHMGSFVPRRPRPRRMFLK